jgi:hypothetical protein
MCVVNVSALCVDLNDVGALALAEPALERFQLEDRTQYACERVCVCVRACTC